MSEVWSYYLWASRRGHGELKDGRRAFFRSLNDLLDNTREIEKPTQAQTDEWLKEHDRNN